MKARHQQPETDAKTRALTFDEVTHNYDTATAVEEAKRCLKCKLAPCKAGCPVNVKIPEFLDCLANGDISGAAKIIRQDSNMPSVCGRVCPQEQQCEKYCVRQKAGGAVAIGALERFVGDMESSSVNVNDNINNNNESNVNNNNSNNSNNNEINNNIDNNKSKNNSDNNVNDNEINNNSDNNEINNNGNNGKTSDGSESGKNSQKSDKSVKNSVKSSDNRAGRVAIVGSGPAGLACAADCARAGLAVTVFEAFHRCGGVLSYGIPTFRLPRDKVERDVERLRELGVEIRLNTVIGKTITLEQLLEDYAAVFIGSGAGLPVFMGLEGETLNNIYSANEYLTRVNLMGAGQAANITPLTAAGKTLVFGGGNVAMDAARTALRLGAESVKIVYRRTQEEMPARLAEVRHAVEEGVQIVPLTMPLRFVGQDGRVVGAVCLKCQQGEPDASGRRSPVPVQGSEFTIDCNTAIIAVGTNANPLIPQSCPQLAVNAKGNIITNDNLETNIKGVFAGGDAVTGAATVISAMGAGKKAALEIIKMCQPA